MRRSNPAGLLFSLFSIEYTAEVTDMQLLITFLEGMISFISPCMLPMLPVYISYFSGNSGKRRNTLVNAVFFVIGFSLIFSVMGAMAGALGSFLYDHRPVLNIICGAVMILFGLSYLGCIRFMPYRGFSSEKEITGVFSAFMFGVVYAFAVSPCVGVFLGSAIMLASAGGSVLYGVILLLVYSLGLGIPFILSALFLDAVLKGSRFIKERYETINKICGVLLIVLGILTAFGIMQKLPGLTF